MTLKFIIHYGFHLLVPLFISYFYFKDRWKKVYLIFLSTMIIDLDHLLANPIFDPYRCSIDFHPLHSYYAILIYIGFLGYSKTRIFGIGLAIHVIADALDCMQY